MQEIENKNTNSIFENIKHIDEHNNDFCMHVNYKRY